MGAVVHQWLSACPWHTDLALHIDFLPVFKDVHDISPPAPFHLFSHVYTIGPTGCQGAAQDQRCLAKHRAPLNSGVRRRQRWMRNSFLSGISCLGAGKVVRNSNLNYKFSVSINIPPR